MEGERVSIPTITPSSPPPDPDFSPVGSPEITDPHFDDQVPRPSDEPPLSQTELRDKIIKQTAIPQAPIVVQQQDRECDYGLKVDILEFHGESKPKVVPLDVIASFRKMKKLTKDITLIVAVLRESPSLVVSEDGKKVKRLHPLPFTEIKDPQLCTVLVENLPEDHSVENMNQIFGVAGNIKNICICDPNEVREARKRTIAEKLLSGKLHALVEYETVDAAEKAVATLNDEQDWRYGMRVKLLKKTSKHVRKKKEWREADFEKSSSSIQTPDPAAGDEENHYSSEHNDDTHDEVDGEHKPKEKNGQEGEHKPKEKNGHKGRNQGRARKQKYWGTNGHGHGTVSSSHGNEISKPPPGPRMPDGTRGFTMGRGRPQASHGN